MEKELEHRLTEVEERSKSNKHRLDEVEKRQTRRISGYSKSISRT